MSNRTQVCVSHELLEQVGRNEVDPDELCAIEEHVSECSRCRTLFDSHFSSSQWSQLIQPALADTQVLDSASAEDAADHSAAILKLLGPTDDPDMLGRIGNYEIVGVIGQGGMGVVFKGFDRSLNRFVAIKMLLPHLAASGAARKRFAREGQAVAAVVDDHVMAIHCVDQWQGIPYLVMTYSRGVSLQKRLNDNGPLELREILRIGMQAAKGLAAAHAQGIVHRDIKPSNILLDQNVERVQLVDFGLARAVDDASLTCSGTLAGTPQYMSPEQARAEAVDHRSDLFSLGSVLYAMCAGHAPFRAESSYSVLRLIIDKEPRAIREINPDMPDWLCGIISKLMAKLASDRFDSARQVAELLEACLAHVQQPTTVPLPACVAELTSNDHGEDTAHRTLDPESRKRFLGPPMGKYVALAASAAFLVFAGVVVFLELDKGTLTIKSVADNVPIRILQGNETVEDLTISKEGKTTRLRSGKYTVEIDGDSTSYEIKGDEVTVKRGEETIVSISRSEKQPSVAASEDVAAVGPKSPEKSNASARSEVERLLTELEFLNKREDQGSADSRSVNWGHCLMALTNIGSDGVPEISQWLDHTDNDRTIASLAFVLRAIGDKRAVPALIRAIPKTFTPNSFCNWIQDPSVIDKDLIRFFREHKFPGQGPAAIGCSNSEVEVQMALTSLTGAKFPITQTYASGTELQIFMQKRLLHQDAERWANWWEKNSSRFVNDKAYSTANLVGFSLNEPAAVEPGQLLARLGRQAIKELPALPGGTATSNSLIKDPFARWEDLFWDLDTGRAAPLPERWRSKPLSESARAELLAWASQEGFDLYCDQIESADKSTHYIIRGLELKAWQVDNKWWDKDHEPNSWQEMIKGGRAVEGDQFIPFNKEKNSLDPSATGTFLFVTSAGNPGLIFVGTEISDDLGGDSNVIYTDLTRDKIGHVKGRRVGLYYFEAVEPPASSVKSQKTDGRDIFPNAEADPLTVAVERFNDRMRAQYPQHNQPPLTKDELVACAAWNVDRNDELSAGVKAGLSTIAKRHKMPQHWTIQGRMIDLPPQATPVQTYQIYLQSDRPAERFTIRERYLAPPERFPVLHETGEQDRGTSLASAVQRFNVSNNRADGKKQAPLTEDEVVAAILRRQSMRDKDDVSDALFERFQSIARTRMLPKDARLEVIPTFSDQDGSTYTIWSIRLNMPQDEAGKEGWTYAFEIRQQFVTVKHGDAGGVHWGQAAENGLKAGVRISPPLMSYQLGQEINVEILYRNILTKIVPASVPNLPEYHVQVFDQSGAELDVFHPQEEKIVGGWRQEYIGVEPVFIGRQPLVLMPASLSPEERAKLVARPNRSLWVFVEPGKKYRLKLSVLNYGIEAKGSLETGEVEFIAERAPVKDVTIDFDAETGVTIVKGAKEDVERTQAVIDQIRKASPPK